MLADVATAVQMWAMGGQAGAGGAPLELAQQVQEGCSAVQVCSACALLAFSIDGHRWSCAASAGGALGSAGRCATCVHCLSYWWVGIGLKLQQISSADPKPKLPSSMHLLGDDGFEYFIIV